MSQIDDQLAKIENCRDKNELKGLLRQFYPFIDENTEIKVFYF